MMPVTVKRHDAPSQCDVTSERHALTSRSYGRTDGLTETDGFRDEKISRYVTHARAGRISRFVTQVRGSAALLAALTAAAALPLSACTSTPAASCKQVMIAQLGYEFSHPNAKAAGEPAACRGVPKATLLRYATEALQQYAKTASPGVIPS